jgi:uncharacterized membrane protein
MNIRYKQSPGEKMHEEQALSDSVIETPKIGFYLIIANAFVPLAGLAAAVMAYVNRDDADEVLKTHYQYQIRTFWIGTLYTAIAFLMTLVLIGFLLFPLVMIWNLFRGFKGLKVLKSYQPMPNPKTWMW